MINLLSGYRWYRRWVGGTWYRIFLKAVGYGAAWINREPYEYESVTDTEIYPPYSDPGQISDGYHTFDELYQHRHALFIALVNHRDKSIQAWKSWKHSDGEDAYEGWFIVGMELPTGQVSYHLPAFYWSKVEAPEWDIPPEWDGHTAADVVDRVLGWAKTSNPVRSQ